MSARKMAGVTAFARILAGVAEGDAPSAGKLADQEGLARSTVFDVIKRMQAADLVTRSAAGTLAPGRTAGAFAYSVFGLGPLFGPAEPLLNWLCNEASADVTLQAREKPDVPYFDLLACCGPSGPRLEPLRLPVTHEGVAVARLSVTPTRAGMSPDDCLDRATCVAAALEDYLKIETAAA